MQTDPSGAVRSALWWLPGCMAFAMRGSGLAAGHCEHFVRCCARGWGLPACTGTGPGWRGACFSCLLASRALPCAALGRRFFRPSRLLASLCGAVCLLFICPAGAAACGGPAGGRGGAVCMELRGVWGNGLGRARGRGRGERMSEQVRRVCIQRVAGPADSAGQVVWLARLLWQARLKVVHKLAHTPHSGWPPPCAPPRTAFSHSHRHREPSWSRPATVACALLPPLLHGGCPRLPRRG